MNEDKKEFKPQFGEPAFLDGGAVKNKKLDGRKDYQPAISARRYIVWASKKTTKTASESIEYAKAILERYTRLVDAAIRLSQNIQLDPAYRDVIERADDPESPALG